MDDYVSTNKQIVIVIVVEEERRKKMLGAKGEGGDGGRSEGKEGMDGLHLNFICMVSDVDVDGMEMGERRDLQKYQ